MLEPTSYRNTILKSDLINDFQPLQLITDDGLRTLTDALATLDNQDEQFQKDLKEGNHQSLQYEKHIELTMSDAFPVFVGINNLIVQNDDLTNLSDDEKDEMLLKKVSTNKVMQWNDGRKQSKICAGVQRKVVKRINPPITSASGTPVIKLVRPKFEEKLNTITRRTDDPLDKMIPLDVKKAGESVPTSSFLALAKSDSKEQVYNPDATKDNSKANKNPICRIPNAETKTVSVNGLRQKRSGKNGQDSYYDITSELHYLR